MTGLPIGVMDSGVGGLAVLKHAAELLPHEDFLFYGDIGNAPYGSRDDEEIRKLALAAAQTLCAKGIKALLVACNTATSAAIEEIRAAHAGMPVLGMEPAIKPACEETPGGRIAVMATPAALRMSRFQDQLEHYRGASEIVSVPCPGLSRLIEERGPDSPAVRDYLKEIFRSILTQGVDSVVVGCTHYIYIEKQIKKFSGAQRIFDGVQGTARHLKRRLEAGGLLKPGNAPVTVVLSATPGYEEELKLFERFYSL
jgi:glutamate racemase